MASLPKEAARERILVFRAQLSVARGGAPRAILTLADTGPGIPEETLLRLFQPFFTTKTAPAGNGLGLYLVRQLVLKNRGKVFASSAIGRGTTFVIELPRAAISCASAIA